MKNYKVRIAYIIVETREFEFQHENPQLKADDVLEFVDDCLDFSSGAIVDREILRENLVRIYSKGPEDPQPFLY